MKLIRWAAVAALTLMSVMNLAAGSDDGVAVAVLGVIAGALGLVAVLALARGVCWGIPAALGISVVNLVASIVALAVGWRGGGIGVTVGLVGLVLTAAVALPVL